MSAKNYWEEYSIKEFLSNMVRVRGEFQAVDTAIQTLLEAKKRRMN